MKGAQPGGFCHPRDHQWKAVLWQGRLIMACVKCPTVRDKRLEQGNQARRGR